VSLAGLAMHSGASGRLAAHSELPGTRGAFGGFRVLSLGDFRRGWRRWHSGHVAFSERLRRRFRRRLRRGHSVGLRDGFERIRDTRRAPKGSERGGCFEVAVEGAFGEIFERVFEKGCEGVFEGGCEGVFRRISERGASGWLRRGLPEGLPRRAATTVGSKIYGSGRSASSDRPNILAVPGRPIGDQRRACVGVFLLPGVSGRADARRRRRDMPAARPANSNRSARGKTERGSCGESKGRSAWPGDHRGKGPATRTVAEARRPSWRWRLQWTGSMGYYPRSTREVRGIFTLGRNDRTATAALGRRRT